MSGVDTIDLGDFSSYVDTVKAVETGETVPMRTFDWFGAKIRLRPHVAPMRFAAFYHSLGQRNVNVADMYGVLDGAIDPDDFPQFCTLADDHDIDGVQLLDVIGRILEGISARPTGKPSESSDGSPTTSPTSTPDSEPKELAAPLSSAERVARDLSIPMPSPTRPDLAEALRLVDEPIELAVAVG